MSNSPFDRVNLGYDGLFGPKTMFYPISTRPDSHLAETLQVPVLDLDRAGWVEIGTIAAISVGTLWICWKLLSTVLGGRHDEAPNYKKTK